MTTSTAQQIPLTRSRRHAGLARAALAILMPVGQFAIAVSGFAMRRLTVAAGNTRRLARYFGSAAIRSRQPAARSQRAHIGGQPAVPLEFASGLHPGAHQFSYYLAASLV